MRTKFPTALLASTVFALAGVNFACDKPEDTAKSPAGGAHAGAEHAEPAELPPVSTASVGAGVGTGSGTGSGVGSTDSNTGVSGLGASASKTSQKPVEKSETPQKRE